jgi:hypothetical protein
LPGGKDVFLFVLRDVALRFFSRSGQEVVARGKAFDHEPNIGSLLNLGEHEISPSLELAGSFAVDRGGIFHA